MSIPTLYTVLPNFGLPDLEGRPVSLWDYKHRQPVVLAFCAEGSEALLRDLVRRYPDYRAEGAEILAIVPRRPGTGDLPFPVLLDEDRRITARCVERPPAILVLDSYNELSARFEGPWEDGPPHRKILGAIAEEELRCPECGVPHWPR